LVIAIAAAVVITGGAAGAWFVWQGTDGDAEPDDDPAAGLAPPGEVVIRMPGADAGLADGVMITTPDGRSADGGGAVVRSVQSGPVALSPTPNPTLVESGPYGPIPKVGADGLRPFEEYARPVAAPNGEEAVVAILIGGLGINQASTELALSELPGAVSLALAPYGSNLGAWAAQAREAGHELFLQVPLEPFDFPVTDPGPHTLLADDPAADNVDRLRWLMAQFTTYAGVVSYAGGRFPQLEALALQRGYAIATASAFRVTIEQISQWAEGAAERGIRLVPITALANDPLVDATQVQIQ